VEKYVPFDIRQPFFIHQHVMVAMHVNDEIFCSASLVLPDKTARILNIGGWSNQALLGIRLVTPSLTGPTDWQQDDGSAQLQACFHNCKVHFFLK
jgi:hypothetical protein